MTSQRYSNTVHQKRYPTFEITTSYYQILWQKLKLQVNISWELKLKWIWVQSQILFPYLLEVKKYKVQGVTYLIY